jgi:multiple sugar transport system substrate-binding protein
MTSGFIGGILEYIHAGAIVPVTDLVKKYDWGKKAAWEYQGENWYYPFDYNLVVNYYRKDLCPERSEDTGDVGRLLEELPSAYSR